MTVDWRVSAACANVDPELFFPDAGGRGSVRKARIICQGCPVAKQCLEFALESNIRFGIFGGLTPSERGISGYKADMSEAQPNRVLMGCGTPAGYTYHLRHGTPACAECMTAEQKRNTIYKKKRRARQRELERQSA